MRTNWYWLKIVVENWTATISTTPTESTKLILNLHITIAIYKPAKGVCMLLLWVLGWDPGCCIGRRSIFFFSLYHWYREPSTLTRTNSVHCHNIPDRLFLMVSLNHQRQFRRIRVTSSCYGPGSSTHLCFAMGCGNCSWTHRGFLKDSTPQLKSLRRIFVLGSES
jgi:hypothetical protein